MFEWPGNGKLGVPGIEKPVAPATLLAGGKKLSTSSVAEGLQLIVPEKAPDPIAAIIKLRLKAN